MLPYNSRTDTLLHVPAQPVIVMHALSSKCYTHLGPQIFIKAENAKQRNGDVISAPVLPAFSPTVSTDYQIQLLVLPYPQTMDSSASLRNRILSELYY